MADARAEHRHDREQHGRHLPLDTDPFLCESVCLEVGRRAADRVLVLPRPSPTTGWARSGGSAATEPTRRGRSGSRRTVLCRLPDGGVRGGGREPGLRSRRRARASLYLHLAPERVQMDEAAEGDDRDWPVRQLRRDVARPVVQRRLGPLDGPGRPRRSTVATAEKGKVLFHAAGVDRCAIGGPGDEVDRAGLIDTPPPGSIARHIGEPAPPRSMAARSGG